MVGKALGPYNILEPLGSGGMGEVYLGEDTRLGRKVAIKVLPEEFASDPERLARFEQEARAAAALNHPHIAVVHDIGYEDGGSAAEARTDPDMDLASLPAAGVHYMVQEYLEGETLREPLKKGALPVQKALDLSTEIAEALNAAHSAGIVHRDLKPENIFVTKEGHAKVLDFGLAKLLEVAPAMSPGGEASKSPTMLGTVAGQVMGTAGYMAPEQVQGDGDIDHRADLFAFGCLLYELLTGRQAFAGRNVLDTLGRIVDQDPDAMSTINPGLPAETERIVRKCLAKEPTKRYQTAGDLVVDLKALGSEVETGAALPSPGVVAPRVDAAPPAASPWRLAGPLAVAALAVGVAVGWFVTRPAPLAPEPSKIFEIDLMVRPPSHAAAISPDGETIVFVGTTPEGDENLLYVRRMNQLEYTPVPGTENALYPFFSPDGEWVGYWRSGRQQGELMKVSLAGGDPFALCDSPEGPHSWWAEDDTIFFTWRDTGGLWSVSANGGEPRLIAEPEATGDVYHRPQLLPGGDAVLVELQSGNGGSVGVVSLADGSYTPVLDEGLDPRYVSSGHLVFGRGDTIWAVGFDPDTMQTIGQQTPVQRGVRGRPGSTSNFEVGLDGTLAFVPGTVAGARIGTPTRLVWLDRQGNAEPLPVEQAPFSRPRLAPAGDEIAVARRSAEGSDIYIYEVADGAGRRLTLEGDEFWPVWTPDGEWVLFGADRGGSENIYRKRADGTTDAAEEVVVVDEGVAPASVSPDGSEVFFELDAAEHVDVLRAPIGAEGEPEPVLDSRFSEEDARLSPDGTLLAYASDRTGSGEIYVLDISTGRPIPVSIGGGDSPFWSPDGSELYFLDGQRRNFMVAAVAMTESGPELGTPEVLFQRDRNIGAPLEPAADGRFLAVERLINPDADADDEQQATGPQINIVLNWIEELRRLAPTRR